MNAKLRILITALVAMTMVLSACASAQATPDPKQVKAAAQTIVAQTEAATCPPFDSQTGWPLMSTSNDGCNYAPAGQPTASKPPASTPRPAATNAPVVQNSGTGECSPVVGNIDNMPKMVIELAPTGEWFHRVFNTRLFNAQNNWGGADSWFVSLALGDNSGGNWTSHGNPGQIVYRGTTTHLTWCLGVLTTSQWKSQFMGDTNMAAAINVRIAPESMVTVKTASGQTVTQNTSDMGDITIILPDSGTVTISVDYTTAAPTHESLVWWGPYDRSENINTVDAR